MYHFQNYRNFLLESVAKAANIKQLSGPEKFPGRETGPRSLNVTGLWLYWNWPFSLLTSPPMSGSLLEDRPLITDLTLFSVKFLKEDSSSPTPTVWCSVSLRSAGSVIKLNALNHSLACLHDKSYIYCRRKVLNIKFVGQSHMVSLRPLKSLTDFKQQLRTLHTVFVSLTTENLTFHMNFWRKFQLSFRLLPEEPIGIHSTIICPEF